jgi:hypothetical protein
MAKKAKKAKAKKAKSAVKKTAKKTRKVAKRVPRECVTAGRHIHESTLSLGKREGLMREECRAWTF